MSNYASKKLSSNQWCTGIHRLESTLTSLWTKLQIFERTVCAEQEFEVLTHSGFRQLLLTLKKDFWVYTKRVTTSSLWIISAAHCKCIYAWYWHQEWWSHLFNQRGMMWNAAAQVSKISELSIVTVAGQKHKNNCFEGMTTSFSARLILHSLLPVAKHQI